MAVTHCSTAASPSGRPNRGYSVVVDSITITKGTQTAKPSRVALLAKMDQVKAEFRDSVNAKYAEVQTTIKAISNVR